MHGRATAISVYPYLAYAGLAVLCYQRSSRIVAASRSYMATKESSKGATRSRRYASLIDSNLSTDESEAFAAG